METALKKNTFAGRSSKREGAFLLLFLLQATALRILHLGFQPLWWDEGYSVWFATQNPAQMVSLTAQDIHPPLYYALLHGWAALLGTGPTALRLFSVAVGVLTIPLLYLVARRMLSARAALLATLLLTISPLHVYYSQEVRMYGLVALLSVGILAAAWRAFDTETRRHGDTARRRISLCLHVTPSPHHLVTYILLTTAALYTQYYAIFLPVGLTIYATWCWRRDLRVLLTWLGAQVIVALLYLPWVIYAAPKLAPYISQKIVADADRPLGAPVYLARHLAAFLIGHLEGPLARGWPAALVLLVPIAIGMGLLFARSQAAGPQRTTDNPTGTLRGPQPAVRNPSRAILMLATVVLTALILGWLISLRAPFFPARGERLLILALPPFILLAAAGLDALWTRWRGVGFIVLGLVVAISAASLAAFYTVPRYPDDDYRALIAHTVEQGLPRIRSSPFTRGRWAIGAATATRPDPPPF